jgi:hypothetical protein
MHGDELRHHLEAATRVSHARLLRTRIATACWPGGSEDRLDRAALAWLRCWRPERSATQVPVCSCLDGRCMVCN